jgi:predicted transcriptional regulator
MSTLERRVQILLDKEQYAQVEREAKRTQQSVAAVIRQAISERLATHESVRAAAARRLLETADRGQGEDWATAKAAMESRLSDKVD